MPVNLSLRKTFSYAPFDYVSVTVEPETQGFIVLEPGAPEGATSVLLRAIELRGKARACAALFTPITDNLVVLDVATDSSWPTPEELTTWVKEHPDPFLPGDPVVVK